MRFLKTIDAIKCDICSREIEISWEAYCEDSDDYHECKECAFISGNIDEKTYLDWSGETCPQSYAGIKDGKVVIWHGGKTPPWLRRKRK